jgi:hypothetical protein
MKAPRKRIIRKRLTSSDRLELSLNDACKIVRRHNRDLNSAIYEAALRLVRDLNKIKDNVK